MTHVPKNSLSQYLEHIQHIAQALEALGPSVHHAFKDSDPKLGDLAESEKAHNCYKMDRDLVLQSALVIAEASFPSIGLGIELEIANENKIPILICYSKKFINPAERKCYQLGEAKSHELQIGKGYVSLMALGLPMLREVFDCTSDLAKIASTVASILDLPKNPDKVAV
jgi:hypothetical protein